MRCSDNYEVSIEHLSFFRPSEEVIDADVTALAHKISGAGCWTAPIPVDRATGVIMDGNHRWHAAVLLGLTHAPCVLLDYADPRVRVYEWEVDDQYDIEKIFRVVLGGRVLPYKSTRHVFAPALPPAHIDLSRLILPAQKSA